MATDTRLWLIFCQLNGLALGYCLYGDSSKCAFQCQCAVDSECDGGQCPSGCDTTPLGYNWAGPACQICNVGLHKSADMPGWSDYQTLYPPRAALDGVSPGTISPNCAHPANTGTDPAEWWTDLGDVYKIYNITIYGRTDCCEERLQQFDLTVYNTSDNQVLCAHRDDSIKTHATMTCTRPVIGRYVHFKRTGGTQIQSTALCEVVIIGHKYIDCTLCPRDVACNDVTGCEQCNGTHQPDCKQACEDGFYGINCKQGCGHCKDGDKACEKIDGRCLNGCEIWWTDTTCNTYIDLPNHNNESVTVRQKIRGSIQIQWEHIKGISANLSDFYGYLIQYQADPVDDNYTEAGIVKYESTPTWKIDKLKPGREYFIEIKPFREYEGKKEFGTPYSTLKVKIDYAEKTEETSLFQNTTIIGGASGGVLAVIIIVVIAIVIIIRCRRAVAKGKQRETGEPKITDRVTANNHDVTVLEANERRRDSVSQEQPSSEVVGYETINEDKEKYESIKLPYVVQYEEITADIKTDKEDQNQYEGLSTSRGATYENFPVEGPYQQLKK